MIEDENENDENEGGGYDDEGEVGEDGHLSCLFASTHVQGDLKDREEAFHDPDDIFAAAWTRAWENRPLVEATSPAGSFQITFAIGGGRGSHRFQGAPNRVAAVRLLNIGDGRLLGGD